MKSINKQKGVALFVTLLVVTIATLLATEIWFRNTLDISRQSNNRASYQATYYASGMVLWANDVLRQDYEENPGFDSRSDPWNQTIAGIELEDAILSGKLIDLDSKFNLNNLVIKGVPHPQSLAYFQRVLSNLELDVGIADKIIDWLDPDQVPRTAGAEDPIYLSKRPAYRTAGQPFVHISELKLVDGITESIYQRLRNFVTVLPVNYPDNRDRDKPTKFNVNTASAVLLRSLGSTISTNDALTLYNRGNASHQNVNDFLLEPAISFYNLNGDELIKLIATKSQWFNASITIKMEQTVFQKYALLYRNSNITVVKQWSDTPF
jgi:general secretion pathway protein K